MATINFWSDIFIIITEILRLHLFRNHDSRFLGIFSINAKVHQNEVGKPLVAKRRVFKYFHNILYILAVIFIWMREWEVWGLLDLLFAKSLFLFYYFIKVTSGLIHWWRELARMPSQWRSTSKNFLLSIFMNFTSLQIREIPLVLWGSGILHHQVSSDQDNEEIQRGKRLPLAWRRLYNRHSLSPGWSPSSGCEGIMIYMKE